LSWFWIVILPFTVLAQPASAEQKENLVWDFANHLYEQHDYYRALSEYQRFIFLFPTDSRIPEAELQIGRCYRGDNRRDKAFTYFIRLFNNSAEEPIARQALLEMIAIRREQRRYSEAIYWTEQFIERYPTYPEIDKIHLHLAFLKIDSGRYDEAIISLERIQLKSRYYPAAHSLRQALQQRPAIKEKSPETAGVLSAILPGSGHLYVGRPEQAIASLLLNGLFVSGAVLAFTHDSPVLGGILVFFEIGWYVGGIRSASQAAREENLEKQNRFRRDLKEKYRLSLGLEPGTDRLALSLCFSF
jgi:tetratricopeptide (TPR) repeat protein